MSTAQNAVTAEPGNGSATIRARVGLSAIDKVTRLFSAGLADIFTETLQNSRRGGANRVAATIEQDGDTTRVTLADDGVGIADPAVLLTFGESNWKDGIAEAEDPAGFGLLALSRRGCTLRWRVPGQDPSPGCRLVLEPAHFLGRDAAHVVPDDSAPWPHGTAVTFEASEAPHAVRAFLETAARHYPLPVTIDGEVIERRAFLDGALHVERWKGLVFGVFKDSHAGYRVPDVNFHGLTLPVRLPQIDTVEGGVWSARADIDSCPDLELVLPARKEAVETPFLEEMREAARLAVYRTMAQADPAPQVAWTDWHSAKEAGIELPEPPAELRPWRPGIADTDYWDERSAFAAAGSSIANRLPCATPGRSRLSARRGWPGRGSVSMADIREDHSMKLFTEEQRTKLLANGTRRGPDHEPVVKLFNPCGAGTWLLSELDPEYPNECGFGLADLGFGTPELGSIGLLELTEYRGPFGLGIERDIHFTASYPLSIYAEAARAAEHIVESGPELEAAARILIDMPADAAG